MRLSLLAALALLCAATPALATGGYVCRTSGAEPIELAVVTGHAVAPVIVQARLTERDQTLSTADEPPRIAIAQSWVDDSEVRLDLVDANAERYEARLRIKPTGNLRAAGTLLRNGKTYRVRCEGEQ
jgi:hypothetical protein